MEIDSLEERERSVRLLAQFTTDHELNIDMADGGIIYFVIRLEDLQAGNYDRVAVRIETS